MKKPNVPIARPSRKDSAEKAALARRVLERDARLVRAHINRLRRYAELLDYARDCDIPSNAVLGATVGAGLLSRWRANGLNMTEQQNAKARIRNWSEERLRKRRIARLLGEEQ